MASRPFAFLGAFLVAVSWWGGAAKAQEFTFKLHTLVPPLSFPVQKFLKPWGEKVEKESKGRIRVDVYPSMQLGGRPEQLPDQVRDGVVDIIWTVPGYTPGRFVKTEVFELPFIHTNAVATNLALQDFAEKNADEYRDYKVLLLHAHAGAAFHSAKPVRKVADFEGIKLRTPSRTGSWYIEALKAVPVGAPVSQVPEMLSKGVVDAVMIPYEIAWALKTHEMVRYHTDLDDPKYPRPSTSVFLFAMNKSRYEALPADLKKVIDGNSGRNIAQWAGDIWTQIEKPGEDAAAASGELIKLPPGEVALMRKLTEKPIHDRWIAEVKSRGIDGAAMIAQARELVDHYTR